MPGEKTRVSFLVLPEAEVLEKLLWSAGDTGLGWLEAPLYVATAGLEQCSAFVREGGRQGEQFEHATLVHATEEITKAQSMCLFKAADLSVGDFCSSTTLKTTASMKQNSMEKAIPGAPPCCLRQLFAANQQMRFFFSVYQ